MTDRPRIVRIDSTPSAAARYGPGWAVVGVDVFRATTLLCTASEKGRRCLVAADVAEGTALAAHIPKALLGGEQQGLVPPGFDVGNSPAEFAHRSDLERPLVLVTSSGTPLLRRAASASVVYAACLRNVTATTEQLIALEVDVAVIGAGTRGERRKEDDFGCAQIAAGLLAAGFDADTDTRALVQRCMRLSTEWCASGSSAKFLRHVGRQDDIDFVLSHVDDVDSFLEVSGTEVLHHDRSWAAHAH
ncbi:MAG: 2-phosphosulfolactate phosphatase [Nocardioidaceae bacterium]|nr:2-phosphosulfolactate phosphatase [Nocardioidaceae bacterium]